MLTEKKTLSTEEIENQTALELPDREVMIVIGPAIIKQFGAADNFCPAAAAAASIAAPTCGAAVIQVVS